MTSKNRQSGRKGREEAQDPAQDMLTRSGLPLKEEGATHLNAGNGRENDSTDGRPGRAQALATTTSEPDPGMTSRRLREGRQLPPKEVAARPGVTEVFLIQGGA